LRHP